MSSRLSVACLSVLLSVLRADLTLITRFINDNNSAPDLLQLEMTSDNFTKPESNLNVSSPRFLLLVESRLIMIEHITERSQGRQKGAV